MENQVAPISPADALANRRQVIIQDVVRHINHILERNYIGEPLCILFNGNVADLDPCSYIPYTSEVADLFVSKGWKVEVENKQISTFYEEVSPVVFTFSEAK